MPASKPATRAISTSIPIAPGERNCTKEISLSASLFKKGKPKYTRNKATANERKDINTDYTKNWAINCFRPETSTLRTPTSLERLMEPAVDRLVKFAQASNKIKRASAPNM